MPSEALFTVYPSTIVLPFAADVPLVTAFVAGWTVDTRETTASFSFFTVPVTAPATGVDNELSGATLPALFVVVEDTYGVIPSPEVF